MIASSGGTKATHPYSPLLWSINLSVLSTVHQVYGCLSPLYPVNWNLRSSANADILATAIAISEVVLCFWTRNHTFSHKHGTNRLRNSTVGSVLGMIPRTTYNPLSLLEVIPGDRTRSKPWAVLGVAKEQQEQKSRIKFKILPKYLKNKQMKNTPNK